MIQLTPLITPSDLLFILLQLLPRYRVHGLFSLRGELRRWSQKISLADACLFPEAVRDQADTTLDLRCASSHDCIYPNPTKSLPFAMKVLPPSSPSFVLNAFAALFITGTRTQSCFFRLFSFRARVLIQKTLLLVFIFLLGRPTQAFNHPGIGLTAEDLAAIKANLGREPWKSAYGVLQGDSHSSLNYIMKGPFATVSRNPDQNRYEWENDMQAIYNLARMWYFTGNAAYAQKAHDILISWATTQKTFGGAEGAFEIGDYAYRYAGGADILRGTWSGWTSADTETVKNYFGNTFSLPIPGPLMTGSQGMEQLLGGLAIAVFNDDTTKFNQVLSSFLNDSDTGLRGTFSNGQVVDTGRDQGHAKLYLVNLAQIGEICWKQGVDVFSVLDNRILAAGEYFARYNLPGPTPSFVPIGGQYWGLFTRIGGSPRDSSGERMAWNILHGAYAIRKGLSMPWSSRYGYDTAEDMDSFMFRKTVDTSTASVPKMVIRPPTAALTTGLINADLNGCNPAGSGTYSGGIWTLTSGYNGADPWGSPEPTVHFVYKQVTGDFAMIAKVTSVSDVGSSGAKAGIMIRDSLGTAGSQSWIAVTPSTTYEWSEVGNSNVAYGWNDTARSFGLPRIPYWIKIERVGSRIQTLTSPDGANWSGANVADFPTLPSTAYVGLFGTSLVTGTSSTATFTNVAITGGDGGAGATVPVAPSSVVAGGADGRVVLRWSEAFGATSYTVYRASAAGGPYVRMATVANPTFTDSTVKNGTTYYYVVSATNSAGTSGYSAEDAATPASSWENVAFGGTYSGSSSSNPNEGFAKPFDCNPGSKWFSGSNSGLPQWIQYDFGSGMTQLVKRYGVTSANDVPTRDPSAWLFQGSNDGSTWTTLDSQTNQRFAYRSQTLYYSVGSPRDYRYYRLTVTAANGENDTQISELGLFANTGHLIANGTYVLTNRNSIQVMDASGGGSIDGTPIIQSAYHGSSNQRWILSDQGGGRYQVRGVASGKVLDVSSASATSGARLQLWAWNGRNNQKWTITPTGEGFFRLSAVHSGQAADVNGASIANGASIIQWPNNGGLNQQWILSVSP